MAQTQSAPDVEDAIQYIVGYLRADPRAATSYAYGYQIYLSNLVLDYLKDHGVDPSNAIPTRDAGDVELSSAFFGAAWELCRRGVLRPGPRTFNGQGTATGQGYSVTPYGERWIREDDPLQRGPVEPGRLASLLAAEATRFGRGYLERSQEALAAHNGHAYLACCAMCGAAAESILLALAIAKDGDERRVIDAYAASGGRGRLEKRVVAGLTLPGQEEFRRYLDLLKYWRDSSAHARAVNIREAEAYTSLVLLLRFALFANERWDEITQ